MSVFIIRTFVRLREMALANAKLARKVDQLELRVSDHDELLLEIIQEIKKLLDTPMPRKKRQIGFLKTGKRKN